jgi:hypothetical protein
MARARRSYDLNVLFEKLRCMARGTQTDLDALFAAAQAEYVETGSINGENARRILVLAAQAQISNQQVLTVLGIADVSSVEEARLEVEQLRIVNRKAAGS